MTPHNHDFTFLSDPLTATDSASWYAEITRTGDDWDCGGSEAFAAAMAILVIILVCCSICILGGLVAAGFCVVGIVFCAFICSCRRFLMLAMPIALILNQKVFQEAIKFYLLTWVSWPEYQKCSLE